LATPKTSKINPTINNGKLPARPIVIMPEMIATAPIIADSHFRRFMVLFDKGIFFTVKEQPQRAF